MPPDPKIGEVQNEIDRLSQASGSVEDFMWETVKLLHDRMLKYNWVGFYMLEEKPVNAQPRMLVLGPFQGAMTPHTRIPLNQGICGAAASTGKTVVIDDVSRELDIDSHFPAAFGDQDRRLVEYCASLVGQQLEKSRA